MKKDKLNYHAIINGNELEDIDELVSITFENKDGTKWTFLPQELTEIKEKIDRIYEFVLRAEGRKEAEENKQ